MNADRGGGGDSLIGCWDIWGAAERDFWVFFRVQMVKDSGSLRVN